MAKRTLIRNAHILTQNESRQIIARGSVLIEEGRLPADLDALNAVHMIILDAEGGCLPRRDVSRQFGRLPAGHPQDRHIRPDGPGGSLSQGAPAQGSDRARDV